MATATEPLTDGVVTLRGYRAEDVDEMVVMCRDPESVRYTTVPVPYERHHAEQWVAERGVGRGTLGSWAIEASDGDGTPRFAGNVDIREGPPPDIGYILAPWARGGGLMARAVRLATRWAFDKAGLAVVHWNAHAGNIASWRVAHACGFTFRGEIPLAVPHRGELCDAWFATLRAPTTADRARRGGPSRRCRARGCACILRPRPTPHGSPRRAATRGPDIGFPPCPTLTPRPPGGRSCFSGRCRLR